MRKLLYAIPTFDCNLSCPHCYRSDEDSYNEDKFLSSLNEFDGSIILFGGEPTLYQNRLRKIISNDNVKGITTNLMILNDFLLDFYKTLPSIATSWNPDRFNDIQYSEWVDNCIVLDNNDIKYMIMVTLTDDLFQLDINELIRKIDSWHTPSLIGIKFELLVSDDIDSSYYTRADDWLCKLYSNWNIRPKLLIKDKLNSWYFNCDHIYTLLPDGTIINRCPHNKSSQMPNECYSCNRSEECRPCRLHSSCSYPHKLSKLIGG